MKFRLILGIIVVGTAFAQRPVTFVSPNNSTQLHADLYGRGAKALILAHGGRFDEKSWKNQAEIFAKSGFLVLALRFRGDGKNPDGSPGSSGSSEESAADVLAAVAYLKKTGAKTVSAVGGSFGGDAVGDADAQSKPGTFDRIVFLGSSGGDSPEKLTGRKLFLVSQDDRSGDGLRLPGIRAHYNEASNPKKLVIVNGSAHAQFLFETAEGPHVLKEILSFLTEP